MNVNTYSRGKFMPAQGLLELIIVGWLFIVVPVCKFVESASDFECAIGIFIEWTLVFLENDTFVRIGHGKLASIQRETS